jgi:hypothetical protein
MYSTKIEIVCKRHLGQALRILRNKFVFLQASDSFLVDGAFNSSSLLLQDFAMSYFTDEWICYSSMTSSEFKPTTRSKYRY